MKFDNISSTLNWLIDKKNQIKAKVHSDPASIEIGMKNYDKVSWDWGRYVSDRNQPGW